MYLLLFSIRFTIALLPYKRSVDLALHSNSYRISISNHEAWRYKTHHPLHFSALQLTVVVTRCLRSLHLWSRQIYFLFVTPKQEVLEEHDSSVSVPYHKWVPWNIPKGSQQSLGHLDLGAGHGFDDTQPRPLWSAIFVVSGQLWFWCKDLWVEIVLHHYLVDLSQDYSRY